MEGELKAETLIDLWKVGNFLRQEFEILEA